MKIFHTADWHLGKLVQGVYMTEDQRFVLEQFKTAIDQEKPDVVIIAGDLYDRAVPPTDAVHLLDEVLEDIVLKKGTPVIAIAGNHDSPGRLHFGSRIMQHNGLHMTGQLSQELKPVILHDNYGEVHFHQVPYCDPSVVRHVFEDDTVKSHDDAMKTIVSHIEETMDPDARHVFVGHAFVTPHGEAEDNTSDSERPLSVGGAEYVNARHFVPFHYTALGHLHQAHYVLNDTVRYAGSLLKYSSSEVAHQKGYLIIDMNAEGQVEVEKRLFTPMRDMRVIESSIEELMDQEVNEDYVFVRLTDETPVLSPMEKVRSVYPNAMHVERTSVTPFAQTSGEKGKPRTEMDAIELFSAFYKEVEGQKPSEETESIFKDVLDELLQEEKETETDHINLTTHS
ncbi:Nuclease SbcCD subunit [Lentibacillus sp. JNUCC-1]|uniref:exonuclease SbcCD subunit D n=1 Tax=Lentibacillus sp. JNUCC-1 TaxID=2654513 RepID=UPI0012E85AAC|nr:exonuclease SbcCD subunit D [Lentibacillus sp. JNUCC-1]MUV36376.1 Nuclease SbcCD subunit [Lentibacillus sp. JNUCC-1]